MKILSKFISYYKPYRSLFYTDMFCAVLVSIVDLSFPQILNYLSKNLFTMDKQTILQTIGYVGLLLLVLYIIKYFCQYYITSWGHIMGARMEADMRRDLFNHYQRLSFSYYDKSNTGEMMSRLVSDLFDISELAHHGPENIFISALKIIGSFILLTMLNIQLTVILFMVTIVMVSYSVRKNLKMKAVFLDNRVKIAKVNSRDRKSVV